MSLVRKVRVHKLESILQISQIDESFEDDKVVETQEEINFNPFAIAGEIK